MMQLMVVDTNGTLAPRDTHFKSVNELRSDMRKHPEKYHAEDEYTLHEVKPVLSIKITDTYKIVER